MLCSFWGQVADEATETKKNKYRRKISKVSTLEFKDNVLKKAERSDSIGELVKDRILCGLGFAASYGKTVQYEISTAYHPQPQILSSESGALVRYVGDCRYKCPYS
ncbi:hypothetical protein TNCV_3417601 [Trichonephila clavipes]|nr:hypothetical protein TNCV_3417601 [Trichonephila clavipes]